MNSRSERGERLDLTTQLEEGLQMMMRGRTGDWMAVLVMVLMVLAAGVAHGDGCDWFPSYRHIEVVAPQDDAPPGVGSAQFGGTVTTSYSTLGLEAGTGLALMTGLEFSVTLAIGLVDLPDEWLLLGGQRVFAFAGLVGGNTCAGAAISLGSLDDGVRLGVPIWTADGQQRADLAIWKSVSFNLF